MKIQFLPGRMLPRVAPPLLFLAISLAMLAPAMSDTDQRVVILRERTSVQLLDGTFSLELLKIRGYMIDVRIQGEKRKLKQGESFSPESGECTVTFQKVSPETPIARFRTDCS